MEDHRDYWQEWVSSSRVFLQGYIDGDFENPNNELPRLRYLDPKDDADEEEQCRIALSTILSTGNPPLEICKLLAALIAPDAAYTAAERKLVFKYRKKRRDNVRDSAIVTLVSEEIERGAPSKAAAFASVARQINMTPGAIKKIWREYKPFRDAGAL